MEQETDKAKRDAMIKDADQLYVDDFAYIPCISRRSCGRRARTSTWCSWPTTASRCAW